MIDEGRSKQILQHEKRKIEAEFRKVLKNGIGMKSKQPSLSLQRSEEEKPLE